MALWGRFFYSSTKVVATTVEQVGEGVNTEVLEISQTTQTDEQVVAYSSIAHAAGTNDPTTESAEPESNLDEGHPTSERPAPPKRFSFKRISFTRKSPLDEEKHTLSTLKEHDKREHASEAAERHKKKEEKLSKSDVRAKKTALRVRMLITGEPTGALPSVSPVVAKPQMNKIKSQLSEPKTANKLIQYLRQLPATSRGLNVSQAPIHAVCLEYPEAEEDSIHFSKLQSSEDRAGDNGKSTVFDFPDIVSAPIDQLSNLLNEMHVVELIKAPNLGLGQPGDGVGILAGAVPTPETVLKGVQEITPQLLALGYATGSTLMPDHSGIYPPTDRISVLTYWWGLEVLLPEPTLVYLSRAQSITSAIVNFLSAMALVNNGVREILPFVRYIAQFIDFEFNSIKAQDKGQGVVCAATWVMPAALVPRPWDFPEAPPAEGDSGEEGDNPSETEPLSPLPVKSPKTPSKRSSSAPSLPKPRPVSSILDIVGKPGSPVLESDGSAKTPQVPSPLLRPAPAVALQI